MRAPSGPLAVALASALAFGGACSGDDPAAPAGDGAAVGAGGLSGEVSCAEDPRVDTYVAGLTLEGERGSLSFRLDKSEPSPPGKGGNTFELSVLDADGAPVGGDLRVALDMPDHGHGTQVEPVVTYDVDSGRFTIVPVYLFMAGVWQIELELHAADSGELVDRTAFHFCIEG